MTNRLCLPVLVAAIAALSIGQARANEVAFDLEWSGAPFGNGATATARIVIDTALVNNPNVTQQNSGFVKFFEITITGAASGNGTFGFGYFDHAPDSGGFLIQDANKLNFGLPLIGQATANGPWGPGGVGDFNIFSNDVPLSHAPNGVDTFVFATDAGTEDKLVLTSFNPAPVLVPEASTALPLGVLFLMFGLGKWASQEYRGRSLLSARSTELIEGGCQELCNSYWISRLDVASVQHPYGLTVPE